MCHSLQQLPRWKWIVEETFILKRNGNITVETKYFSIIEYLTCWKGIASFCMLRFWTVQWKTMKILKRKVNMIRKSQSSTLKNWPRDKNSDKMNKTCLHFPSLFPLRSKLLAFALLLPFEEDGTWCVVLAPYMFNIKKIYKKIIFIKIGFSVYALIRDECCCMSTVEP